MSSALKVSTIASDLAGGGITRVYLVASVLQQMGCEVTVIGPRFGPELYPPPPTLKVISIPAKQSLSYVTALRQVLSRTDGDLIYAIKPRLPSLGTALLKKTFSKQPVIVDIDDWEMSWVKPYRPKVKQLARDILKPSGALHNPEHALYVEWMENCIRQADGVSVTTHFLRDRFGGHYLPNGKDTQIFDPDRYSPSLSRQKYGLDSYKVLMFPGTVRPHKGLEDVLEALDQLDWPDLRLVIVGGNQPDDYEDKLFRQWSRWLIKLPRFPTEEMAEVVAAAHIVVVPQRDFATARAQFPLKLTDGMSMAKPVIATRVGDIPEILEDVGYLVDPQAPSQIAEKITLIFGDLEAAHQTGKRARDKCVAHYSTQSMAKQLTTMFGEMGLAR